MHGGDVVPVDPFLPLQQSHGGVGGHVLPTHTGITRTGITRGCAGKVSERRDGDDKGKRDSFEQ